MVAKIDLIASTNPFTGAVEREFSPHTAEQVVTAIRDAQAAFEWWRARPVSERAAVVRCAGELMLERVDELAELATREMGKLLREAKAEVELAASILTYYGEHGSAFLADRTIEQRLGAARVVYEPLGVILTVEPWNFPYYHAVRPAAPALVAGNVVLLKHASVTPQCGMAMERLFVDAGAPSHVYTNLLTPGNEVSAIVDDERVRAVALAGSEGTGASVATHAGKHITHSVLELGGSDPFIVLEDVDLEQAIGLAVAGRVANAGQVCTSPKRMIVVGERYDAFVDGVVARMEALVPGDPRLDSTTIGPLASELAVKYIEAQVDKAVMDGATLLTGGHRMDRDGWFFEPTVLVDIDRGNYAYSEELVGPVAMIYRAATEDEAVRLANDVRFGLGATILTADINRGEWLARRIESGMVWINQPTSAQPELPFGGIKSSGYGRVLGVEGMLEFTNHKLIRMLPLSATLDATPSVIG